MAQIVSLTCDNDYEIIAQFNDGVELKLSGYRRTPFSEYRDIKLFLIKKHTVKVVQYHGKLDESDLFPGQRQIVYSMKLMSQQQIAEYLRSVDLYLQDPAKGTDTMRIVMHFCLPLIENLSKNQVTMAGSYS